MTLYDNKNLDVWLESVNHDQFPNHRDYFRRYVNIKNWISEHIYDDIKAGALFAEVTAEREPVYLNNHGKAHVECVIGRATEFIRNSCKIDPYQIYILLVAILLHDAGNIYGRKNHESMCRKILSKIGDIAGDESAEQRIILQIAQAHAGYLDADKDTIAALEPSVDLYGRSIDQQLLAAILRFADELADDTSRASRFMLKEGLLAGSELFHAYSYSLKSVRIEDTVIRLRYELLREDIENAISIGEKKMYLIDEIFTRVTKMYLERVYCSRYIRCHEKYPVADRISVKIAMYESFLADTMIKEIADPIEFTLEEKGYPIYPPNGIYDLCPGLEGINGKSLSEQVSSPK